MHINLIFHHYNPLLSVLLYLPYHWSRRRSSLFPKFHLERHLWAILWVVDRRRRVPPWAKPAPWVREPPPGAVSSPSVTACPCGTARSDGSEDARPVRRWLGRRLYDQNMSWKKKGKLTKVSTSTDGKLHYHFERLNEAYVNFVKNKF